MPYPITLPAISAGVEVSNNYGPGIIGPGGVALALDLDMLFTTSGWGGAFPQSFSAAIEVMSQKGPASLAPEDGEVLVLDLDAIKSTSFSGIGPGGYIPSFPQLDRNTTNYPHAF